MATEEAATTATRGTNATVRGMREKSALFHFQCKQHFHFSGYPAGTLNIGMAKVFFAYFYADNTPKFWAFVRSHMICKADPKVVTFCQGKWNSRKCPAVVVEIVRSKRFCLFA